MTPFLKFYLKRNPRFQTEIKPFVPGTREDFELTMSCMSHGCTWTFEEWNIEMEKRHNKREAGIVESEVELANIAVGSKERLKELEENGPEDELFIKWIEVNKSTHDRS